MSAPAQKLGPGEGGVGHFLQQRITALLNVPLVLFGLWLILSHLGATRADLASAFGNPVIAILSILAIFSFAWHMRLGAEVVIEDYVTGERARHFLLALNTAFAGLVAAVAILSILWLGFGA